MTASCTVAMQQLIASKQRLAKAVPRLQGCEEQAKEAGGGRLFLQRNDPVVLKVFAHYSLRTSYSPNSEPRSPNAGSQILNPKA